MYKEKKEGNDKDTDLEFTQEGKLNNSLCWTSNASPIHQNLPQNKIRKTLTIAHKYLT